MTRRASTIVIMKVLLPLLVLSLAASAQDTTGILEGQIADASGGAVAQAEVVARNPQTGVAARLDPLPLDTLTSNLFSAV